MKITDNNYISFVKKKNFLDMTRQELRMFFFDIGEKIFHADQVMKWIYHYYCSNFDCMTNISKKLRIKLKLLAEIKAPKIVEEYKSVDGTMKWSVQVDNQKVEMVYIPEKNRSTVCISSQVGCKLRCSFCFTGKQGFNRNLKVSEIIGQVWNVGKRLYLHNKNKRNSIITNVVLMGMGEPLLNLSNVISSIRIMLDDFGFGLSKQHITISTAGIAPAIDKLIGVIDVGLAISLHAPNNSLRNNIMPINRRYNIEVLFAAIRRYLLFSHANRGGVTIEYVMIGDINDSLDHAYQLGLLLKNIRCKVNLIPWNSFSGARYVSSSENRIKEFSKILIFYGLVTIVRKTRGDDIGAACGQLSGEVINLYRFFPHSV